MIPQGFPQIEKYRPVAVAVNVNRKISQICNEIVRQMSILYELRNISRDLDRLTSNFFGQNGSPREDIRLKITSQGYEDVRLSEHLEQE